MAQATGKVQPGILRRLALPSIFFNIYTPPPFDPAAQDSVEPLTQDMHGVKINGKVRFWEVRRPFGSASLGGLPFFGLMPTTHCFHV